MHNSIFWVFNKCRVLTNQNLPCAALLLLMALPCLACSGSDAEEPGGQCEPFYRLCIGNAVYQCNMKGQGYEFRQTCTEARPCFAGECGGIPAPDMQQEDLNTWDPETLQDGLVDVATDNHTPDSVVPDLTPDNQDPDVPHNKCGNGKLDPGEICDPLIVAGVPGYCPVACSPPRDCLAWKLSGSSQACSQTCVSYTVTETGPADSCCPSGATFATDSDCPAQCGNGAAEGSEDCDGNDIPATCESLGFGPGTISCVSCAFDTSLCAPKCGNNVAEAGEDCDGIDIPGSCESLGKGSGSISCDGLCNYVFSGCSNLQSGPLEFVKVPNLVFKDDFEDVAWHPDGDYALLLQTARVVRYTPSTDTLDEVGALTGTVAWRMAFHPTDDYAVVAGSSSNNPVLWRVEPASNTITKMPVPTSSGVTLTSLAFDSSGQRLVVGGTNQTTHTNWLYMLEAPFETVAAQQVWSTYTGLLDVVWAESDPLVFDAAQYVFTSEGWNGADSRTWLVPPVDTLVDNGWKASFGNPGRGAWQPGGIFGALVATSTNKLYIYEQGTWNMLSLPIPGPSIYTITWNPDGSRCLLAGRASSNPLKGTLLEWNVTPGQSADSGQFTDRSIPNFSEPPYNATSNTAINALAWRPNSDCQEGLIAASDNGDSWSPTFGIAVRFYDQLDPDCQN